MSAICQNTSLNSPLNNNLLLEALDGKLKGTSPRNNRIRAYQYYLGELHNFVDLTKVDSHFTQNLSYLYKELESPDLLPEAEAQWKIIHQQSLILGAAKMSVVEPNQPGKEQYMLHQDKLSLIQTHPHYPALMSSFKWKWFLENLVVGTCRPSEVSKKYGVELNPFLTLLNPWNRNPVFKAMLGDHLIFYATSCTLCVRDTKRNATWLVSREHLLQLSDTATQRYSTLYTAIVAEIYEDSSVPSFELLTRVFDWGDEILAWNGNDGYKAIKMWEPLLTSYLINFYPDSYVDTQVFQTFIKNEFLTSLGDDLLSFTAGKLSELENLLLPYLHVNPDILSQLFGLYRIWGHPTVDGIAGVIKLKTLVSHEHVINYSSVELINRKWREYFSISYYTREKRWPKMRISEDITDSYLLETLRNNSPLDRSHPEYNLLDWQHIQFLETFSIPERFELSEMISDKATSLDLGDLAERCLRHRDIGLSKDRSVIIQWLRSNYQSPIDFLKRISENGFDKESETCGVYPKEREGKNEPRLFGLMTLMRRLYIVITEALISDYILKYFPEITMTYSQSSLYTRLHQVTRDLSHQGENEERPTSIVTNIDFEKWNSNMREPETMTLFSDFDDLFGIKQVFSRSHELFSACTFYLADGTITPEFKEKRMITDLGVWNGHLGGIEGLRQKGWTVFTAVILKYICEWRQVSYQLMGQGDNQVLITKYYPQAQDSIKVQHLKFLHHLDEFLKTIGPPLKLEESWSSSTFFTYGKFPILKGVPLSMSLKRISRCNHLNNEGIASVDSVLSSISANLTAAVQMSKNPLIPVPLAAYESVSALYLILTTPFYGLSILTTSLNQLKILVPTGTGQQLKIAKQTGDRLKKLTKSPSRLAAAICLVPSALGGYPIFMSGDIIMHGFPDPVSIAIWECKALYKVLPDSMVTFKEMLINALNPPLSGMPNPELLCQSPTSLNILKGSRPKDQIKRMVMQYIPKIPGVVNEAFQFFFAQSLENQRPLANLLYEMTPLHPRIAASIYESTPTGVAMSVVERLQSTKTLETMMIQNLDAERRYWEEVMTNEDGTVSSFKPRNVSELNHRYEINQLKAVLIILNNPSPDRNRVAECCTQIAERLRCESWGKPLKGVTVAVPMEVLIKESGIDCDIHDNPDLGYIRCQTSWDKREPSSNACQQIGTFKPFFGSTTSEKVKYDGGQMVSRAPPMFKTALKNLRLINWGTQKDSNLTSLIVSIFNHMTDLNWELLIPQPGSSTGTLEHRWADTRTDHGVSPSINFCTSTHFTVNTNRFKPENSLLIANSDNVNINHQALFSYIAFTNMMSCIKNEPVPKTTHWHVSCRNCIMEVDESYIDIPHSELLESQLSAFKDPSKSPYVWVSKERMMDDQQIVKKYPCISGPSWQGNWESLTALLITEWFLKTQPLFIKNFEDWSLDETQMILPLGTVQHINASSLLMSIAKMILARRILSRIGYWINLNDQSSVAKVISSEIQSLLNIPTSWYKSLNPLFLSKSVYELIRDQFPDLASPLGTPPTQMEMAKCIKDLVDTILLKCCTQEDLRRYIVSILSDALPRSSLKIFHPEILTCFKHMLLQDKIQGNKGALLLRSLGTCDFKELVECSNEISLLPLLTDDQKLDFSETIRTELDLLSINIVDSTPDYALKRGNPRSHPEISLETSETVTIDMNSLLKLPKSWSFENFKMSTVEHRSMTLTRAGYAEKPLHINTLYKEPLIVTSAPFKLLSCFNFLQSLSPTALDTELSRILCLGDGTGGFTALSSQLFPSATIIYNSLFVVENQSSVGCDGFIPAALCTRRANIEKVEGILCTVEGSSDITDLETLIQLTEPHETVSMVICDAEGDSSRNVDKLLRITRNILNLCRMKQTTHLILKSYLSRVDLVLAQMFLMDSIFHNVNCVRSVFSGYNNSEVYIICKNRRALAKEASISYMSLTDQITLNGTTPTVDCLNHLKLKLLNFPFAQTCAEVYPYYQRLLKLPGQENPGPVSWKVHLMRVSQLEKKEIRFPQDFVMILEQEYKLLKFKSGSRGLLRKNLLNISVAKQILTCYLSWCLVENEEDQIKEFEENHPDLYFCIYETITRKWTMTLSSSPHKGHKYKSWRFEDLADQKLWRDVYTRVRMTRQSGILNTLELKMCGAKNPPHVVGMVTDFPDWKGHIGDNCAPVSQLPHPSRDQKLVITSGCCELFEHDIVNMGKTLPYLKSLIDRNLVRGDAQRLKRTLEGMRELNERDTRFLTTLKYYREKYDF